MGSHQAHQACAKAEGVVADYPLPPEARRLERSWREPGAGLVHTQPWRVGLGAPLCFESPPPRPVSDLKGTNFPAASRQFPYQGPTEKVQIRLSPWGGQMSLLPGMDSDYRLHGGHHDYLSTL